MINMYKERLKAIRERNGLTQTDLANLLNIDRSQYGKYENEYTTIPIKHLNTLCNYFQVSLDYIFNFSDIKQYKDAQDEINKVESGKRLKVFRKEYKITQTKLANFLSTSFSNISAYERGINILSTTYLYAICKKYHISADYLLGKINDPSFL